MKKFTSIILALAMLSAMMITMIPTASAAWDGSSVSASLVGSGTELDPYLVSSENDLAFIAHQVNTSVTTFSGEFFKLTTDIDLGGREWTPIGKGTNTTETAVVNPNFAGTFLGNGKTIRNFRITTTGTCNGLFGIIHGGNVYDLAVKDFFLTQSLMSTYRSYSGGIAGILSAGNIERCMVNGKISNLCSGIVEAGLVVGNMDNDAKIANCFAQGDVTVSGAAGGIAAGIFHGGTILNSCAVATL